MVLYLRIKVFSCVPTGCIIKSQRCFGGVCVVVCAVVAPLSSQALPSSSVTCCLSGHCFAVISHSFVSAPSLSYWRTHSHINNNKATCTTHTHKRVESCGQKNSSHRQWHTTKAGCEVSNSQNMTDCFCFPVFTRNSLKIKIGVFLGFFFKLRNYFCREKMVDLRRMFSKIGRNMRRVSQIRSKQVIKFAHDHQPNAVECFSR